LSVVTSDQATALGLATPQKNGGVITGSAPLLSSLLSASAVALRVNGANGDVTLNVNATSGSSDGVDWALTDGRLTLSSRFAGLKILDPTEAQTAITRSAGFIGSGRDTAKTSRELHLSSAIEAQDGSLVDGSASVSNVGETLSLTNEVREGLIVALASSSSNGLRRLVGSVPKTDTITGQATPDVRVRILSSNSLEIVDPLTGISLANRSFKEGEPVTFLGLQFTIRGTSVPGDEFAINFDTGRTGDNRNALTLARMSSKSIFAARNGTFQDVYNSVTAKLGATVQVATNKADAAKKSSSDLKAAYDSKVGVDLDKEAADLLRYQQAYQAAAQVVMAARDMFSTILKVF
jgi:flagellar basal body rod protein FlgC